MKILTWNINGLRAAKKPLKEIFDSLDADVICLQETKITREELPERVAIVEGYSSYFSFSKKRSGYSGVATYVKESATPYRVEEGITGLLAHDDEDQNIGYTANLVDFDDEELKQLDAEGRVIMTQHQIATGSEKEAKLVIINVYNPRVDPEKEERKIFKLHFCQLLEKRIRALLQNSHVILLGDMNISHQPVDHCDPDEAQWYTNREDRVWFDTFIRRLSKETTEEEKDNLLHHCETNSEAISGKETEVSSNSNLCGMEKEEERPHGVLVDTFRYVYPTKTKTYTCWNTMTGARATNYGTRIDYILADPALTKQCTDCYVMMDVQGSDHCPVKTTFLGAFVPSPSFPSSCTKYWPEFSGKQKKLLDFFKRTDTPTLSKSKDGGSRSSEALVYSEECRDMTKSNTGENNSHSFTCIKTESKESVPDTSLKRVASCPLQAGLNKKPRLEKSKSGNKQSSLMNFF